MAGGSVNQELGSSKQGMMDRIVTLNTGLPIKLEFQINNE